MNLDCKLLSTNIKNNIKDKLANNNNNNSPGLGIILVGENMASLTYIKHKKKACDSVGILFKLLHLSENSSQQNVIDSINLFNKDNEIHGILVQLPLPKHISEEIVLKNVSINKDVDGFHANNIGNLAMKNRTPFFVPCTPLGCVRILTELNYDVKGKNIVVIGKSNIVGLPIGLILNKQHATVTMCDEFTTNIKYYTRNADVLIVACGQPKMITKDYIKNGCIIIDIGINHIENPLDKTKTKTKTKIVGDVDYDDVKDIVSYITPVPGGVGPMTIAMLIENTYKAYCNIVN
jgi:methylenetetrahydrofolate dehydrogenase (NADP+) / methenyltetrahydrofolate cyclohydrolase